MNGKSWKHTACVSRQLRENRQAVELKSERWTGTLGEKGEETRENRDWNVGADRVINAACSAHCKSCVQ